MTWWVYLIKCGDGSLYCGIAKDVDARFQQHREGRGARYTKGRGPLELLYREGCGSHSDALKRELMIKRLRRVEKLKLGLENQGHF
jgi:predicted GIY-YIG superfamily endonuclease